MKARLPQGFGGGASNMNSMIKQAQKMQEDLARIQEELEQKEYTAAVGGGTVEIVMTGKKVVKSVKIKPEVVDPEDVEMLEDLIVAAINEVVSRIDEDSNSKMQSATGGLSVPGLF